MIGTLVLLTVVGGLIYLYLKIRKAQAYWDGTGVPHKRPIFFFGDNFYQIFRMMSPKEIAQYFYETCPGIRYSGVMTFLLPGLFIKDPELIKEITVKAFDHFTDHMTMIENDPVWDNNLLQLKGKRWRDMRATLSPAFTGSKMKQIFVLMTETAQSFVTYFEEHPEEARNLEMKDTLTRYANDVIASSAYGIKCDSVRNKTNDFYTMGKELTSLDSLSRNLSVFACILVPKLCKILGITAFPPKVTDFFNGIVKETIKQREAHSIKRPDMIDILMEAKKGRLHHEENEGSDGGFAAVEESDLSKTHKEKAPITDEDIAGQALIFFFAGFETVSTSMTFTAYELAINPDVQKRLQEEIDGTLLEGDGKVTYESLSKMKYLDMVVSESLRKWAPAVSMDRRCTKPYTIEPKRPEESPVHLKVGAQIWYPIMPLHMDPKYFPDPERFDPERFNDENKKNIVPYTYLPFGSGPRVCVGSRFAILEIKLFFFHLLSKFNIVATEKTQIPIVMSKKALTLQAEGGIWVGFEPRQLA